MIYQRLDVRGWHIDILYECTCDDIDTVIEALRAVESPSRYIKEAVENLETCNLNIGLTYSNLRLKSSVIVVNKTTSHAQFVNTVTHEFYHLICHLKKAFNIKNEEELATLNGDLNMQSYAFINSRL